MSGPQTPTPPRATSPIPCKFPIYTVDYTVSHVHKLCKHKRNCQRQHKSDNTALSQSGRQNVFNIYLSSSQMPQNILFKAGKSTVLGDVTLFFSDIFRDGLRRRRNGKQLLFRTVSEKRTTLNVLSGNERLLPKSYEYSLRSFLFVFLTKRYTRH